MIKLFKNNIINIFILILLFIIIILIIYNLIKSKTLNSNIFDIKNNDFAIQENFYNIGDIFNNADIYYKIIKLYNDTEIIDNIIGEVEITEFNGLGVYAEGANKNTYINYIIPTQIIYNTNIYLIVSIGPNGFLNSNLSGSLTIPGHIKTIGERAFYSCSDLNNTLTIGEGVETIGQYAFYNLNCIGILTIPSSIKYIGESAFEYCTLFTSLIINNGLETIDSNAFCHCNFESIVNYSPLLIETSTLCNNKFILPPTTTAGATTSTTGVEATTSTSGVEATTSTAGVEATTSTVGVEATTSTAGVEATTSTAGVKATTSTVYTTTTGTSTTQPLITQKLLNYNYNNNYNNNDYNIGMMLKGSNNKHNLNDFIAKNTLLGNNLYISPMNQTGIVGNNNEFNILKKNKKK